MKEEKRSRNPFHWLFGCLKNRREPEVTISETKHLSRHSKPTFTQNVLPQPAQTEPPTSEPTSHKSLWEQAAENLDSEFRQALDDVRKSQIFSHDQNEDSKGTADVPSLPELVTREAQRRLEDMDHRQWALPVGFTGKRIEIRSLLGKFIALAKVVKDNGDAFIELDPTGYAKLSWLPFSIFVDLSAKHIEQHQAALDAFSEISFLIYRYAQVENIYHKRHQKEAKFEECLVDLYKAVLDCEVALLHYFRRHGFLRFLRSIPAVDGWKDRVISIKQLDQRCQSLVDIHVAADNLDARQDVDQLVEAKRREEINEIFQWIIDHDPLVQRKLVLEKLGKTYLEIGKWLLEHETFTSWLEYGDSSSDQYGLKLLWLHGPVGCGKTSLTTRAIEHFLEQSSVPRHHDEQVSYFYCAKTHGLGSKPLEIFQSMTRQLSWSPKDSQIEQYIKDEWEKRHASKTDRLSLDDCKDLLLRLITRARKTIFIIDALDECDNPTEFLEALKDLSASFQEKRVCVNVFISSRDEVHFAVYTTFPEYLDLKISPTATEPDLRQYIKRRVDDKCKHFQQVTKREYSGILQRLVDELTERGQLAFRWTELQLALFFPSGRPPNPIDIERRLESLKDRCGLLDLNNTYKEIYDDNISKSSTRKDDLHFLLKWTLASQNAHIKLLTGAIKFHYEQQRKTTDHINRIYILDLASNLLVIDEHDTIQFSHISVKEYFQDTTGLADEFAKEKANSQVAETCLQYLLFSHENFPHYSVDRGLTDQIQAEFSYYSLTRWALHYSRSGETGSSTVFKKLIPGASAGSEFAAWVSVGMDWRGFAMDHVDDSLSTPPCPFFLSCIWGFMGIVNETIHQKPEYLKALNHKGRNGLHLAAYYDQRNVVKALIRTNMDINLQTNDPKELTALQQAVIRGNTEVVRILLLEREDVDVNISGESGDSAIHQAVKYGHAEIVRVLLDYRKDLNINAETMYGDWGSEFLGLTPLHLAISMGRSDIVTILLEKRDDIRVNFESLIKSPLHMAIRRNYVDIVDTLLRIRDDIDVHMKDNNGRTALHIGSMRGQVRLITALLHKRNDLDVNIQDNDGCTALYLAVRHRHIAVIETLLRECENIQVNTKEVGGQTALHLACQRNNYEALKALLEGSEDLNVNIRNRAGNTALHLSVRKQQKYMVDELATNPNVDPNIANDEGQNPLHIAASIGNVGVLESLLKFSSRININARNNKQQTALHLALSVSAYRKYTHSSVPWGWPPRSTEVVRLLLQNGIDTTSQDKTGKTALYIAAEEGHSEAFSMIFENCKNANPKEKDDWGRTMLHWAAENNEKTIVEKLIQQWPDCVNVTNGFGQTAVHLAFFQGNLDLGLAILGGQVLENYTDLAIKAKFKDGQTGLHILLKTGFFNDEDTRLSDLTHVVVGLILEKYEEDVEINARDVHGRTVSHMAAQFGRFHALYTILENCYDVDLDISDKEGRTILHHTASRGHMNDIVLSLGNREEVDLESSGEDTDEDSDEDHDEDEHENHGEELEEGDDMPEEGDSESDDGTDYCDKILDLLLEKCNNATLNAKDNRGLTALHLASSAKDGLIVEKLLSEERGIDVNAQDDYGWTALHVAVWYQCIKVVKTLLTKCVSIDMNIQDRKGRTPLHLAASKGGIEIVKELLDNGKGVNLNLKDEQDRTALDLAIEGKYVEAVNMLESANGHVSQLPHGENGSN